MTRADIIEGDALATLRTLPDASVQTCVTSPPYWGLRDYGVPGQLGLEPTPEAYVAAMVAVFAEVRRVLRDDGTLWLNMGDSYASGGRGGGVDGGRGAKQRSNAGALLGPRRAPDGLKDKDLVGIPWRLAFALQADGWWLRSDIIWSKPNPMPESVTDRPTKAHEYLFLLSKRARYYYDAAAIAEQQAEVSVRRLDRAHSGYAPPGQSPHSGTVGPRERSDKQSGHGRRHAGFNDRWNASEENGTAPLTRNARSVWTIATTPFADAHFATFPPELPRRCILAGSRPGDLVLDPFAGAGTTGLVAHRLGRNFVGVELNADYAAMARERIRADAPLLAEDA